MTRAHPVETWVMGGVAVAAALLLVVPVPPVVLDLAYAASLTFSVALVGVVLTAPSQVALGWYPRAVVLLALTRVSLTVAATRLVLTRGDAGSVVRGLGQAVAGSSVIIGLVVLVLLIVVQLVVVGRGAERVAEVAARFSLDALPGAQLSLDGDVRAGALEAVAAKREREDLLHASRLSGALDGASRFVRGDAVASVLLLTTSLIGGVLVGVLQRGATAEEAFARFGLLTVGEGIGAQIPALLASVATGLLVTRVDDPRRAPHRTRRGGVALLAGAFAFALAVVPGLPALPFVLVGAACVAFGLTRPSAPSIGSVRWLMHVPEAHRRDLVARVDAALAARGFPLRSPELRVHAGGFSLTVNGLVVGVAGDDEGLTRLVVEHAPALIGVEAASSWLDRARERCPTLVATVVPSRVSTPRLGFVLADLASEGVSLANHEEVLEACLRAEPAADDARFVENARKHLPGSITASVAPTMRLDAVGVDRAMLTELREATRSGRLPETVRRELCDAVATLADGATTPVVMAVPAEVRRTVRRALGAALASVSVVGLEELVPVVVVSIGREVGPSGQK